MFPASCKYGSAPFPGYLRISTRPPKVKGDASRPGREWVRYAAQLVDPARNTVQVSNWSAWLRAGDGTWGTWGGETSFKANWRGNYRIELRIEWWNQSRRISWQAHRITQYYYFDEWNTAWGGPFASCMRQPTQFSDSFGFAPCEITSTKYVGQISERAPVTGVRGVAVGGDGRVSR